MVDSIGHRHYPKDVILYAVFFYVRYAISYRDLENIMAERGIQTWVWLQLVKITVISGGVLVQFSDN